MLRKLALACVAVAALGTAALSSTDASAREWRSVGVLGGGGGGGGGWHGGHGGHGGGWHGGHRGWGGHRGYGYGRPAYYGAYGSCTVRRLVATPYGYRYRLVNRC